jgi:hypothetical protein
MAIFVQVIGCERRRTLWVPMSQAEVPGNLDAPDS